MVPRNEVLRDVVILPGYEPNQLPNIESRINHARALYLDEYRLVFGIVGPPETIHSLFQSELRFVRTRLTGNLVLGSYVTWPENNKVFAPSGLAIWQRPEVNS